MKLLFDIEKVIVKTIEYLKKCEKSIEYWRSVRNSKSHILKNHCRDDRSLEILDTVNKYISPILKKDEYFTSILKTCAFTSNSISIRQKKKLKRPYAGSNESVIDFQQESRELSDSSSNSDEDEDEDDELVRQIVDQIDFPESKIETDGEIKQLPSLISNSVGRLSDCQIKKSEEFEESE